MVFSTISNSTSILLGGHNGNTHTGNTKGNHQNDRNNGDRPTNRRRFGRGDVVINENQYPDMKVPSPGTYHDVFSPDCLRGLKFINHADGTQKCNNYHHRGRCHTKCDRVNSHNKNLSTEEVAAGKKFVMAAFKKWQNQKTKEPTASKIRTKKQRATIQQVRQRKNRQQAMGSTHKKIR